MPARRSSAPMTCSEREGAASPAILRATASRSWPRRAHERQSMTDRAAVEALLGRPARSDVDVVVRSATGEPVVIRNPPILDDGTPMPTRFWLVGDEERRAVSGLEAEGGVRAAEAAVDHSDLERAHRAYASER